MVDYTQLSFKERKQISTFLDMGWSVGDIALRLGRHRSTLYRELNRNSENSHYFPKRAHNKAQQRKHRRPTKLVVDSNCYKYVLSKLKQGWSPEQISGRMRLLNLPYQLCHESIYQYIYRHGSDNLYQYLPRQQQRRKARRQRKPRLPYEGIRAYTNRPKSAETREHIGHWEGDTIRFSGERRRSITTLVDRKSRFTVLCKNERSTSLCVMSNVQEVINTKNQNRFAWHTITFDQGSEFSDFAQIERHTPCKIYYARARSPWLRGTNENTNGRLRRFLPKKASIKEITQYMLDSLANLINNTPRKCLDYLTPNEVFYGLNSMAVALDSRI